MSDPDKIPDEVGGNALQALALSKGQLRNGRPENIWSMRWEWLNDSGAPMLRIEAAAPSWPFLAVAEALCKCDREPVLLPKWTFPYLSKWQKFEIADLSKDYAKQKNDERAELIKFIHWRTVHILRLERRDAPVFLVELIKFSLRYIREHVGDVEAAKRIAKLLSPYDAYLSKPTTKLADATMLAQRILADAGLARAEGTVRENAKEFARKLRAAVDAKAFHTIGPPFLPTSAALRFLGWEDLENSIRMNPPLAFTCLRMFHKSGYDPSDLVKRYLESAGHRQWPPRARYLLAADAAAGS